MSKKIIVTIDGPAGAGKSTTAKAVAEKTGLPYLDTGALYRAVAWKLDKEGVAPEDGEKIAETLKDFKIEVAGGKVTADGEDVTRAIRTARVDSIVSAYAARPEVRDALAGFQRREQGVGEGDTVMIAAPNIVAYFVLIGAIQLAGATVALMSPTVERAEFAGIYDHVHPAVAIVSTEAHCRLAAECSPATKVMTATCPVDGVLSVEQAWRGSAAWDGPSFDEDPKFVLFTSGSTGTPKARSASQKCS